MLIGAHEAGPAALAVGVAATLDADAELGAIEPADISDSLAHLDRIGRGPGRLRLFGCAGTGAAENGQGGGSNEANHARSG